VKILPPEVGADSTFSERFTREARALAKLSHQNIVSVFDFGQADGLYYFVMEYVDGANLRQVIAAGASNPEEALASEEALAIVPQICEALRFAHDEGIVHRDIKPENILVDKQGRVKIADFGLAKLLGKAPADLTLTGANQAMGTLHYMAPEQMQGAASVDHRADIYSLGVVFYEMLTGQLPIGRFEPPSKKVHVDVRLDEVVLRSLESDPARRYQSVSDVKIDLESVAAESASHGVMGQPSETIQRVKTDETTLLAFSEPRFSRKAIVGAFWAPLFFVVLASLSWTTETRQYRSGNFTERAYTQEGGVVESTSRPAEASGGRTVEQGEPDSNSLAWWQWVLLGVLPFGLLAPFGTTILGCVAISDIRHSRGRLIGLLLAVADSLFFPLLVVDGLIFALFTFSLSGLGSDDPNDTRFAILLAVLVAVAIDWYIARAAWRKAADGLVPLGTASASPPS
jgi:hypothetical protein